MVTSPRIVCSTDLDNAHSKPLSIDSTIPSTLVDSATAYVRTPSALSSSSPLPFSPASWTPSGRPPSYGSGLKPRLSSPKPHDMASSGNPPPPLHASIAAGGDNGDETAESPASERSDDGGVNANDSLRDGDVDGDDAQDGATGGDRPRVRAEGPGGAEIKRGARIACLECRSAKIRCSAPNDGQVPCKVRLQSEVAHVEITRADV